MNVKERNIFFYSAACQYLNGIKPEGVDLEKYLTSEFRENQSIEDIYRQFIGSAQNYQSMPNVIAFHTPENLAKTIVIEAAKLLRCYQWDKKADLDHVKEELADVIIYCQNMDGALGLNVDAIINEKIDKISKI